MNVYIDADSFVYKLAYFNKDQFKLKYVENNTIKYIDKQLKQYETYGLTSQNYVLLLTSNKNFRKSITDDYKKNRKKEKPKWIKEIYKIIRDNYKTLTIEGYEADDLAATLMKNGDYKDLLVHWDKDLLQIPGIHLYREELIILNEYESFKYLISQLITGDSGDNIKGIVNYGKVKAKNLIEKLNVIDLLDEIIKLYIQQNGSIEEFYKNYKLLKLKNDIIIT